MARGNRSTTAMKAFVHGDSSSSQRTTRSQSNGEPFQELKDEPRRSKRRLPAERPTIGGLRPAKSQSPKSSTPAPERTHAKKRPHTRATTTAPDDDYKEPSSVFKKNAGKKSGPSRAAKRTHPIDDDLDDDKEPPAREAKVGKTKPAVAAELSEHELQVLRAIKKAQEHDPDASSSEDSDGGALPLPSGVKPVPAAPKATGRKSRLADQYREEESEGEINDLSSAASSENEFTPGVVARSSLNQNDHQKKNGTTSTSNAKQAEPEVSRIIDNLQMNRIQDAIDYSTECQKTGRRPLVMGRFEVLKAGAAIADMLLQAAVDDRLAVLIWQSHDKNCYEIGIRLPSAALSTNVGLDPHWWVDKSVAEVKVSAGPLATRAEVKKMEASIKGLETKKNKPDKKRAAAKQKKEIESKLEEGLRRQENGEQMCDSESGEEGSEESSQAASEGEGSSRSGEESSGNEEEGSSRSGKESSTHSDSESSRTSGEASSVELMPVRKTIQRRKPLKPIGGQNDGDEASGEDANIATSKKGQDIQAKYAASDESSGDQRSVSSNDSANGYQPGKDATPDLSSPDEEPSMPQTRKRKGAAPKKSTRARPSRPATAKVHKDTLKKFTGGRVSKPTVKPKPKPKSKPPKPTALSRNTAGDCALQFVISKKYPGIDFPNLEPRPEWFLGTPRGDEMEEERKEWIEKGLVPLEPLDLVMEDLAGRLKKWEF